LSLHGSTNNADYGNTTNSATFTVVANVQRPTRYQWRFNGEPISGQTTPTLVVPNVGLAQEGNYDVVVTDDISSATSNPARLKVLVTPQILQPPANQLVTTGGYFTASVVIRGNPPPYRYEWREISAVRVTNITSDATNFITYGPAVTGPFTNRVTTWRLVIFGDSAPPQGIVASFSVTSAQDTDNDGIPDLVETAYGLNPNVPASPTTDTDGDGVSDLAEYLAGTNPTNAASRLTLSAQVVGNATTLSFQAESNKTYSVRFTDSLGTPRWRKLADIAAQPVPRQVSVLDPGPATSRFYQVVTPWVP
jgi:thrombospondin type 3 repeat protein